MVLIDVWREHEQQRPHPQRRTHYTTVRTKRTLYFVVFVLVPVYSTTFVFCIFFVLEKSGESFLKFTFFSFRLWWKESTFGYSQFWWEEEILTLVADQGLNFFPFLFDCLYFNGNVGAGSDFLSSFEIFWKKWMIPNKLDPLCRPSMGRRRPSWTTNKGLPFGHDPRIFRWNANPPYWYYTWTPPRVKFVCIMRGGTRWWPDVMCS